MKRYNRLDNHMLFLWIVLPILVFFISMNATYAYFTASVTKDESKSQTGLLQISFTSATAGKVNSASITESTKLLPGDTISVEGAVQNSGTIQIYAILEFKIDITKTGESNATTIINKYYTFSDSTLTEIVETESGYNAVAFTLDESEQKSFTLSYEFDFYIYDNTYKNALVNYSVTAYAIQTLNLTDMTEVTRMLMESEILPKEYQQVQYIESTGTQWIDTGVVGKSGVKMVADINVSEIPTNASPFCGSYGNNQRCYMIMLQPEGKIGMSYITTSYSTYTLNVNKKYKIETDFTLNKQSLKVNDETILSTNNSVELNTGNNIFIFGYNHSYYSGADPNYPVLFKLYNFKLYDHEALVRDYVPCYRKSDNTIGLYDIVNNVFYTNSGSGSFLKGANV